MTQSDTDCRWLVRRVIVDGEKQELSLVELRQNGSEWSLKVEAFERETHSTAYYPGTLKISTFKDRREKPLLEFE